MSPPSSCRIKPIFLLGSNHAQTPHLRPSLGLWGGGGGFGGSLTAGAAWAAATAAGGSWPRVCAATGAAGVTHCCAGSLMPVATPRDGKSAAEKAGVSAGADRFEAFYRAQNLVSSHGEWKAFIGTLHRALPTTFRVSTNPALAETVAECMASAGELLRGRMTVMGKDPVGDEKGIIIAQHDLLDEAGRLVFSCLTRSVFAR